jgi:hypothetical protein
MAAMVGASAMGCSRSSRTGGPAVAATPVYNQTTGRLEQLVSDRDGDGKADTWAFMDGARIDRIEMDTNADGVRDRVEIYAPTAQPGGRSPAGAGSLVRVDLAKGTTDRITRREFYENLVLARVEEDTDDDGRVDKWEDYVAGALRRMDLDVTGRGKPDRRLVYGSDGSVTRIEADPDGDGQFAPVSNAARGGG